MRYKGRLTFPVPLSQGGGTPPWPGGPHATWYKDFGSFKLCGKGALPLTVLSRDQKAFGTKL
jgi:hypothetical protein